TQRGSWERRSGIRSPKDPRVGRSPRRDPGPLDATLRAIRSTPASPVLRAGARYARTRLAAASLWTPDQTGRGAVPVGQIRRHVKPEHEHEGEMREYR